MGRKKIKDPDLKTSMENLLAEAVSLYKEPYDDRKGREEDLPSVRSVASEMGTTVLRIRKLLITAGYYSTTISRRVQVLHGKGLSMQEIMEQTALGRASVNSYLPYRNVAFNLDPSTVNADRLKRYRQRKKAVRELRGYMKDADDAETGKKLWNAIRAFEGYPFREKDGSVVRYKVRVKQENCQEEGILTIPGGTFISRKTAEAAFREANNHNLCNPASEEKEYSSAGLLVAIFLRLGVVSDSAD